MPDEVVTLDSDEEGKEPTTKTTGGADEEIVMEYNHNDYADLVGPPRPSPQRSGPPGIIHPSPTTGPPKLPKRPGSMPPFALFSQEMRAKLQAEEPDIGFGELGRRLGEMWHSLKEEEKEDYRRRAREVADAKMKSWKETVSAIPKHKQLQMEQQQPRRRVMKIKKKKTSGYAIFTSEQRRKYASEQPELQFSDISKKVAEDWRLSSEEFKREYEEKAQRYNIEEEKRWRQRIYIQQQQQMKIQANRQQMMQQQQQAAQQQRLQHHQQQQQQRYNAQQHQSQQQQRYSSHHPPNAKQAGGGQGGPKYRQILPQYSQQQQQQQHSQQHHHHQSQGHQSQHAKQRQYNSGNQSGLVISSVSSLSSPSKDMSGLKLPSGITIHRAEPEINLPSSITISRVEPEIQIVEENIVPHPPPQPNRVQQVPKPVVNPQQRVMSRGRPVMARGARPAPVGGMMRGRGVGRPPGMSASHMAGRGSRGVGGGMGRGSGGMGHPRVAGPVAPPPVYNHRPRGMQARPGPAHAQGIHQNGMSPRGPTLVSRPRLVASAVSARNPQPQGVPQGPGGLKRPMMAPRGMAGMPPMKRPRMPAASAVGPAGGGANYGVSLNQLSYSTTGAVNPATLAPFERLCRVCGIPNNVIFRLTDKPEVIQRLDELLNLSIDLKEDERNEYPSVVCRKCCNLVETFHQFNKQIKSGQDGLKAKVEQRRKSKEKQMAGASEISIDAPASPGSIGVDPLETSEQTSVFGPVDSQPDTQVGKIKIKQESLKHKEEKEATPITTVFTDLKIKIEPGIGSNQPVDKQPVVAASAAVDGVVAIAASSKLVKREGKVDKDKLIEGEKEVEKDTDGATESLDKSQDAGNSEDAKTKSENISTDDKKDNDDKEESNGLFANYPISTQDTDALFEGYPLLGAEPVTDRDAVRERENKADEDSAERNDDLSTPPPLAADDLGDLNRPRPSSAVLTVADSAEAAEASTDSEMGQKLTESSGAGAGESSKITDPIAAEEVTTANNQIHTEKSIKTATTEDDITEQCEDDIVEQGEAEIAEQGGDDIAEQGEDDIGVDPVSGSAEDSESQAQETSNLVVGEDEEADSEQGITMEDTDNINHIADDTDEVAGASYDENGLMEEEVEEDNFDMDDLETETSGLLVRNLRGDENEETGEYFSDYYQDEDGTAGTVEDASHLHVEDGDPLLGMETGQDGIDSSDDFGGYDPLKLVEMSAAGNVHDVADIDADDDVDDAVDIGEQLADEQDSQQHPKPHSDAEESCTVTSKTVDGDSKAPNGQRDTNIEEDGDGMDVEEGARVEHEEELLEERLEADDSNKLEEDHDDDDGDDNWQDENEAEFADDNGESNAGLNTLEFDNDEEDLADEAEAVGAELDNLNGDQEEELEVGPGEDVLGAKEVDEEKSYEQTMSSYDESSTIEELDETNCDDNPSVGQAGFQAEPNDNALHAPGSTVQPIVAEVEGAYQPLEQEADESTGGSSSNYIPELETVEAPGDQDCEEGEDGDQ